MRSTLGGGGVVSIGCVSVAVTRGVQNCKNFADVIYGWSLFANAVGKLQQVAIKDVRLVGWLILLVWQRPTGGMPNIALLF